MDISHIHRFQLWSGRGPALTAKGAGPAQAARDKKRKRVKGVYYVVLEKAKPRTTKARIHTRRLIVAREMDGQIVGRELVPR